MGDEQPVWKRDFPISWVDDHLVTRRGFTRSLVGLSCASFAATAALAAKRSGEPARSDGPALALPEADALPVGATRVFDYPEPGHPCLLIRTGPNPLTTSCNKTAAISNSSNAGTACGSCKANSATLWVPN